jgi:hypothetical protein
VLPLTDKTPNKVNRYSANLERNLKLWCDRKRWKVTVIPQQFMAKNKSAATPNPHPFIVTRPVSGRITRSIRFRR